jgi:hypothetical protein
MGARLLFLSQSPGRVPDQEIPDDWARDVLGRAPGEPRGTQVAPGVRVALLGTGDFILPGDAIGGGALIAVWD